MAHSPTYSLSLLYESELLASCCAGLTPLDNPLKKMLGGPQSQSGFGNKEKLPAPAGNRIAVIQYVTSRLTDWQAILYIKYFQIQLSVVISK
jgi:hypothetical protein